MPLITLNNIAKILNNSEYINSKLEIDNIVIDSRKVVGGSLFIAIVGKNDDGHNYITDAIKNDAVAVIISKKITSSLPMILVDNTRLAFGKISAFIRNNVPTIVFAITGSNGKTTTKNMLGNILKQSANTLINEGNFNNDIGVPITLCNLSTKHKYAVVEMGANHLCEIKYLCTLAKPNIALVINATDAHIGEFGSWNNLVQAKSEIYQALDDTGIAIINNDLSYKDKFTDALQTKNIYKFGTNSDIYASNITQNHNSLCFTLHHKDKFIDISMQLIGKHNIENALAATCCAISQNISLQDIKLGLESTKATNGRMCLYKTKNNIIIDDSYNANPESMRAAIMTLSEFSCKKVLVLGLMAELGHNSKSKHLDIVNFANNNNIDYIYSLADNNNYYQVTNYNNKNILARLLLDEHKDSAILIKGSRCEKMERIVQHLKNC